MIWCKYGVCSQLVQTGTDGVAPEGGTTSLQWCRVAGRQEYGVHVHAEREAERAESGRRKWWVIAVVVEDAIGSSDGE